MQSLSNTPYMRAARTVIASLVTAVVAACAVQPAQHANLQNTVHETAPAAWRIEAPQVAALAVEITDHLRKEIRRHAA